MKQVFNNNEVAHVWAQGSQDAGRNSQGNFYFNRGTIYSYGSHFPIATMEGNTVFFTLKSYSNTTAKHIGMVRRAISHKEIIFCNDVPVKYGSEKPLKSQLNTSTHENNLKYWKGKITALFAELGNKKNRNTESRVNDIQANIAQLKTYCLYFGLPIKDKELKNLLEIAEKSDFIELARQAGAKDAENKAKKMKQAAKAYEQYLNLWRAFDETGLQDMPAKTKELCNFYVNSQQSFTRLRLNTGQNRLETSKGGQIPVEGAKPAYIQLNGFF